MAEISKSIDSDFVYDFFCELCIEDNQHKEAEGYCVDCGEYLCESCYNAHRKTRATRHHVLQGKDSMPKDTPLSLNRVSKDIATKCKLHRSKPVEYYCGSHDVLGCSTCFMERHRGCSSIESIVDISVNILDNQEFKDFLGHLQSVEKKSLDILVRARENTTASQRCYTNVVSSVKRMKENAIIKLNEAEENIVALADWMKTEDEKKMESVENNCETMSRKIEQILSDLETLQTLSKVCQLYISMRELQGDVISLQKSLEKIEKENVVRIFRFEANPDLASVLRCPDVLGKVSHKRQQNPQIIRSKTDETQGAAARPKIDETQGAAARPKIQGATARPKIDETQGAAARPKIQGATARPKIDETQGAAARPKTDETQGAAARPRTGDTQGTAARPRATGTTTKAQGKSAKSSSRPGNQHASASRNVEPASVVDPSKLTASHVADINIISDSDTNKFCYWISGSAVVSADRLLLADYNNHKVKLVDTRTQSLLSELQTSSPPWDVAVITPNQAAVTLPDSKKFILIGLADTLTLQREINVSENCHGVAYSQDRLVVTFVDSPRVEIIDLHGNVIRRIEKASDGSILFESPEYVCVNRDGEIIYVSDFNRHTVTSLTFDGVVKSVYKDKELSGPRKVCTDHHGNVYVCGFSSDNVYIIAADCRKIKVILTRADGLDIGVSSVSHCQDTNMLFIGMFGNYSVKVFQLS